MASAIIGGTGLYKLPGLNLKEEVIKTEYGTARLFMGQESDSDIVFLTRHGVSHSIPPHKINYRANIQALHQLGVKRVIGNYAVGGINPDIPPLGIAILNDFLDFTNGRDSTFFDDESESARVSHVEMSAPYCSVMSDALAQAFHKQQVEPFENGVYAATNGPRFETPAEIRMMGMLGADVVGMTGVPEVILAREIGMCFAGVALSINWAAGIKPSIEIVADYSKLEEVRLMILRTCVEVLRSTRDEDCVSAKLL
ncbi:MAG: S-methyl-5'-thioinosine phosphorylase [Chloroflexota bacterium]